MDTRTGIHTDMTYAYYNLNVLSKCITQAKIGSLFFMCISNNIFDLFCPVVGVPTYFPVELCQTDDTKRLHDTRPHVIIVTFGMVINCLQKEAKIYSPERGHHIQKGCNLSTERPYVSAWPISIGYFRKTPWPGKNHVVRFIFIFIDARWCRCWQVWMIWWRANPDLLRRWTSLPPSAHSSLSSQI